MRGTVIKFGGTSLGDAARIGTAATASIQVAQEAPLLVVVSAMAGVTRRLRGIAALARTTPTLALAELDALLDEHREVAAALRIAGDVVSTGFAENRRALITRIGSGDRAAVDRLLAGGERLSAVLLHGALTASDAASTIIPAENLIATDARHGHAEVDRDRSRLAIIERHDAYLASRITLVAGFTGASPTGATTTLGSNSSDYSAALIAAALGWPLQIRTDVSGCYDADPRHVPGAQLLSALSLIDAHRYARAGASVIHPRTLEPLLENPVEVSIVNSFAADVAGTRIGSGTAEVLHGIAWRDDPGDALSSDGFTLAPDAEATSPHHSLVEISARAAMLSVFDDRDPGGLIDRCRQALAATTSPPLALWWSPSQRCVRIAVDPGHAADSARALHAALFLRRDRVVVAVALIGASGRVARRLVDLIAERQQQHDRLGIELRLIAVADSRRAHVDARGIAWQDMAVVLEHADIVPLATWSHDLLALQQRPLLVLDCTASAAVAAHYPEWLAAGIDVITPNKHGPAADAALSRSIATARAHSGAQFAHETTVGAQLPLLRTLRDLAAAGDAVEQLDAVLSGTLSFVFAQVRRGVEFSSAVQAAIALGYAEPHPAADLSGADAARKLVILLRALGVRIDLADVEIVAAVPADLIAEPDASRLLAGLAAIDASWTAAAATAAADGETWIYRASYRDGSARVRPERIAVDHALARLSPCENALQLSTRYYHSAALTISGPGAGIDLTAAGVYADLLGVLERYRPASTAARQPPASRVALRAA